MAGFTARRALTMVSRLALAWAIEMPFAVTASLIENSIRQMSGRWFRGRSILATPQAEVWLPCPTS